METRKKIFQIFVAMLLSYSAIQAQYYTPDRPGPTTKTSRGIFEDWKDRIYFGGNVGLGFGNKGQYIYIEATPLVGYRITDRFSLGNTFAYIYLKQSLYYSVGGSPRILNYQSHIFGISPFARMFLTDWFFLHGEYNIFNAHLIKIRQNPSELYTERGFIAYPLIGGGFVYRIGNRGGIMLMALFNPLYASIKDKFPIYTSPLVLRVGFFF